MFMQKKQPDLQLTLHKGQGIKFCKQEVVLVAVMGDPASAWKQHSVTSQQKLLVLKLHGQIAQPEGAMPGDEILWSCTPFSEEHLQCFLRPNLLLERFCSHETLALC